MKGPEGQPFEYRKKQGDYSLALSLEEKKEKCFKLIDDMIDEGIDVMRLGISLRGNKKYVYSGIRRRFQRVFGSVKQALIEYGIYDSNGIPTKLELLRCFYIDENYSVKVNPYEKVILCDSYFISENEFNRLAKEIMPDLKRDAVDEFYRNEFPENTKYTFFESGKYKHLQTYIKTEYGGLREMMEFYGTPSHIFVDYDYHKRNGESIKQGHIFEQIVLEILSALYEGVQYHIKVGDCIPDFVIDNRWYDAKLSRYVTFQKDNSTIERYLKHTEDLTFIYAKDKCKPFGSKGAKFIHVSYFYDELKEIGRQDLVDRCEIFLHSLGESEAKQCEITVS